MALDGYITIDNSNPSDSGLYVTGLPGVTIAQLDGVTKDEQADYQATFEYIYALAQTNLKIDVQRALAQRFHIDKKLVSRETSKFIDEVNSSTELAGVTIEYPMPKYGRLHISTVEAFLNNVTIPWRRATIPVTVAGGIFYGGGLFVAFGNDAPDTGIATSEDGITWTARTNPTGTPIQTGAYGDGVYVLICAVGNRAFRSVDGITWTSESTPANNDWSCACFFNNRFIALATSGIGNRVMTSTNGETWTIGSCPDATWVNLVAGDNRIVAIATDGEVMISYDGIGWDAIDDLPADNWSGLTYHNGMFVAASTDGDFAVSTDGRTWRLITTFVGVYEWNLITSGDGWFMAIDDDSVVAVSKDGTHWDILTDITIEAQNAAFGNHTFVTIFNTRATYGAITTETDGGLSVMIYDNDQDGELLGVFTAATSLLGRNVVSVNSDFEVNKIFIAFDPAGLFRKTENKYYPDGTYGKLSCTFPCAFGEGSVTQVNGGGLNVKFNVFCSMMKVIEDNINLFQYALWYRIGVDIMKERVVSDRVDRFTVLTPERAVEMTAIVEKDYQNSLEAATMNLKFNEDPICFVCKKPIQAYTSLP